MFEIAHSSINTTDGEYDIISKCNKMFIFITESKQSIDNLIRIYVKISEFFVKNFKWLTKTKYGDLRLEVVFVRLFIIIRSQLFGLNNDKEITYQQLIESLNLKLVSIEKDLDYKSLSEIITILSKNIIKPKFNKEADKSLFIDTSPKLINILSQLIYIHESQHLCIKKLKSFEDNFMNYIISSDFGFMNGIMEFVSTHTFIKMFNRLIAAIDSKSLVGTDKNVSLCYKTLDTLRQKQFTMLRNYVIGRKPENLFSLPIEFYQWIIIYTLDHWFSMMNVDKWTKMFIITMDEYIEQYEEDGLYFPVICQVSWYTFALRMGNKNYNPTTNLFELLALWTEKMTEFYNNEINGKPIPELFTGI